jgi:hypothetical protein
MLQTFTLLDPILVPTFDPVNVPDDISEFSCPHCGELLSLHLPDPQLSDRMLATCEECKSWYLLDRAGCRIVMLPDFQIR